MKKSSLLLFAGGPPEEEPRLDLDFVDSVATLITSLGLASFFSLVFSGASSKILKYSFNYSSSSNILAKFSYL